MRKKTTVTRTLPCRLTDAELMERANRLASLFQADKEMSIRHKREKQPALGWGTEGRGKARASHSCFLSVCRRRRRRGTLHPSTHRAPTAC